MFGFDMYWPGVTGLLRRKLLAMTELPLLAMTELPLLAMTELPLLAMTELSRYYPAADL